MARPNRTARRRRVKKSRRRSRSASKARPDFDAILGRLCDAMAIISTATRSMAAFEQIEGCLHEPGVNLGEELITLEHGVRALRAAYDEIDVAIRAVSP